jgi:hypothetical protein
MRVARLPDTATSVEQLSSSSPTSVIMSTTTTTSGCHVDGTMDNDDFGNNPRSCILQIGVHAGRLCELANTHPAMIYSLSSRKNQRGCDTPTQKDAGGLVTSYVSSTDHLAFTMADLFFSLWLTSRVLKLNMIVAIQNKLRLNEKKYPVELCKVRLFWNYFWWRYFGWISLILILLLAWFHYDF